MINKDLKKVPQARIVRFVAVCNWVTLVLFFLSSFLVKSVSFSLGIVFGGLLVCINFHLLTKTIIKALTPPYIASYQSVIAKYYIRFGISGIIIFLLLANEVVAPLGLILGLSVVVTSFFLASILEIKKIIFKEAV